MSMTTEEIEHGAELEEMRLGAIMDRCAERIAELANKLPRNADERHDLRVSRENAVAAYEEAQERLSAFWAIATDEAMAEYLERRALEVARR